MHRSVLRAVGAAVVAAASIEFADASLGSEATAVLQSKLSVEAVVKHGIEDDLSEQIPIVEESLDNNVTNKVEIESGEDVGVADAPSHSMEGTLSSQVEAERNLEAEPADPPAHSTDGEVNLLAGGSSDTPATIESPAVLRHRHWTDALCLSMAASNGGTAGCDASSCRGHAHSDATLQPCNLDDPWQRFAYSASDKLLRLSSDISRCLSVGTSHSHSQCEPFTLMNCVEGKNARARQCGSRKECSAMLGKQQFSKESRGGSTVWRNEATGLAIDVNNWQNLQDNWVWACPGTNSAKYFDPISTTTTVTTSRSRVFDYDTVDCHSWSWNNLRVTEEWFSGINGDECRSKCNADWSCTGIDTVDPYRRPWGMMPPDHRGRCFLRGGGIVAEADIGSRRRRRRGPCMQKEPSYAVVGYGSCRGIKGTTLQIGVSETGLTQKLCKQKCNEDLHCTGIDTVGQGKAGRCILRRSGTIEGESATPSGSDYPCMKKLTAR